MKVLVGTFLVVLSLIGLVVYSYIFAGCDVPLEYQKQRLLDHLAREGLTEEFLAYDEKGSTDCRPSFIYKSKTEHIHFVLVDGGSITSWDYNAQ